MMMGRSSGRRKEEEEEGVLAQKKKTRRALEVKVPSFFRCPISLDVMRSPVSLCTGVTYDRSSIQRWLQSGNATCPATMQPLSSTDLVPNLTLLRLIRLWNDNAPNPNPNPNPNPSAITSTLSSSSSSSSPSAAVKELLREARDAADPAPALREIAAILEEDDEDEGEVDKDGLAAAVAPLLRVEGAEAAAARVLALVLAADGADKRAVAAAADPGASAAALARVLRTKEMGPRVDAARVLESLIAACGSESEAAAVAEAPDLIPELIRLAGEGDAPAAAAAAAAAMGCLAGIGAGSRRGRGEMVTRCAVGAAASGFMGGARRGGRRRRAARLKFWKRRRV
ncbi:U-box domain-containing protein 29-like [Ananas comosus]|uniref:U-box domain-containing protein n=1 Tax=Ananas comosus TaxID=4615 RepID=A0A6P5GUE9_ANACO|nr:U-box domain-containing protein 29-like [Ananas comosus]